MSQSLLDRVLSGEAFEGLPLKLHREGKNVILCEDKLPGNMYIVYPNKKACLISYDKTLEKSIVGRELTQEEYQLIGIENYA